MTEVDEFIDGFLSHRDPDYDPVKAHEYYMRTRKLKGKIGGRTGDREDPEYNKPGGKSAPKAANRADAHEEKINNIQRSLELAKGRLHQVAPEERVKVQQKINAIDKQLNKIRGLKNPLGGVHIVRDKSKDHQLHVPSFLQGKKKPGHQPAQVRAHAAHVKEALDRVDRAHEAAKKLPPEHRDRVHKTLDGVRKKLHGLRAENQKNADRMAKDVSGYGKSAYNKVVKPTSYEYDYRTGKTAKPGSDTHIPMTKRRFLPDTSR